ncbi:histidine kinase [Streptococcus pneumoniae]|nr:histidine kinase [Streptococcus pneumoniae]
MLERLKSIHYMFWASLIFMLFPILPVVTGWLSAWHLLIDILFVVAYLGVLTTKSHSCFCRFNDFWLGSDSYCGGFERSSG